MPVKHWCIPVFVVALEICLSSGTDPKTDGQSGKEEPPPDGEGPDEHRRPHAGPREGGTRGQESQCLNSTGACAGMGVAIAVLGLIAIVVIVVLIWRARKSSQRNNTSTGDQWRSVRPSHPRDAADNIYSVGQGGGQREGYTHRANGTSHPGSGTHQDGLKNGRVASKVQKGDRGARTGSSSSSRGPGSTSSSTSRELPEPIIDGRRPSSSSSSSRSTTRMTAPSTVSGNHVYMDLMPGTSQPSWSNPGAISYAGLDGRDLQHPSPDVDSQSAGSPTGLKALNSAHSIRMNQDNISANTIAISGSNMYDYIDPENMDYVVSPTFGARKPERVYLDLIG